MTRKSEETEQNFGNVVTPPQNSTDLQEILSDQNSIQMDLINSDTESEHDHTNKKSITDTVTTELSESSPLLTHHDNKQTTLISTPNKTAGSIGCLVLCISGISVAIFLSIRSFDSSQKPNLKFKFKTPYAGGGTILISNEGNHDVEIQNIQFKINGIIDTNKKGSIYGDLAPWGEATIQAEKTDGIWTTYNIKEPSNKDPVILKAGKTSNCTYVFGSAKGTLDVGVMPDEVSVTIDKNEYQLALADRCQEAHCEDPVPEHHLGGFYTDWDMYQRQYNVEDIPIDKINHVYYAFLSYDKLGNLALLDSNSDNIQLPMLMQLQKQYPYLKVMLSVGGATNSADFPALAANPVARENFARNLVAVLDQFSFSGIDIDWETPNSDEASDFIALLKVIRQTMDATGKQYKLTIAAPAGKQHIDAIGEQWQQVADVVDAINVMAYDYNGPWSEKSDYQSPVALPPNDPLGQQNSLDATRSYYQQYKVNTAKINLGMPAYFRGVTVANMQNNGMWQTVTGTPEGQFDNSGVFDYRCAVKQDCNSGNTLPEDAEYLSVDKAPYGNFSETPMFKSNNVKAVYTGDSVTSVKAKSTLVKKNNYQGVFFWTLSGDVRHDDTSSLVVQAQQVLSGEKKIASKAPAPQNSEPDLSFDYSIPYQGAGKLTIHNKSNQPKTIKKLVFDSNVNISGTPYGSLWKYGATITAEDNPDGITKTYTISETEAGIVIPANTELDLTFSYQ